MLYDSLENMICNVPSAMPLFCELVSFLKAAREYSFEELKEMDFPNLDLRFGEYETKDESMAPFEAHRILWDLQIVLCGREFIGYAPLEDLTESVPYDGERDIAFYSGSGQNFLLRPGMAVLLAPWDGHRPGVSAGADPSHIKKIVVKLPWPVGSGS